MIKKTNKISRIISFLLACITLLLTGLPIFADVIFEPYDDFFRNHRDECEDIGMQKYYVNSDDGYACFYKAPESDDIVKEYQNGEELYIQYLYTDKNGDIWGDSFSNEGWVRMSELSLEYNDSTDGAPNILIIVGALVGGIVVVTAVAIVGFNIVSKVKRKHEKLDD